MNLKIGFNLSFLKDQTFWEKQLFSRASYWAIASFFVVLFISIGLWSYGRFQEISQISETIENFETVLNRFASDEEVKKKYSDHLASSDPSFLANFSQKTTPFSSELTLLENVIKFNAFKGFYPVHGRIKKLRAGREALNLKTTQKHDYEGFCQTEHRLVNSIHVNESDLKELLVTIEGVAIEGYQNLHTRPDLFFKRFKIVKKEEIDKRQVYDLDFEIIRRDRTRR